MKKLVALAMILAVVAPSMAGTTVSVAQVGSTAAFNVNYAFDGTGSAPRAFALDITTNLGTFTAVVAAKTGESVVGSLGYGIFPGTILIDSTGSVTNIGSPVAQHADLPSGTLSDLPATGITLELGSLYATTAAKPAASGTLVTVTMSGLVAGNTATISIVPNTARGGVVLEDATSLAAFTQTGTVIIPNPPSACFFWPTGQSVNVTKYNRWTASGSPACWCPPTSVTGLAVGGSGYQCLGDADGKKATGTNIRVGANDLTKLKTSWNKVLGAAGYDACADIDHAAAVGTNIGTGANDLGRMTQSWNALDAALNTKLGVGGTGGYCGQATVPTSYR